MIFTVGPGKWPADILSAKFICISQLCISSAYVPKESPLYLALEYTYYLCMLINCVFCSVSTALASELLW